MVLKFLVFSSFLIMGSVDARGNIEWGLVGEGILAYHEIHENFGLPLTKQVKSVLVRVAQNEKIEAVRVYDLVGDSTSVIQKGGLGEYYVAIELESARGEPYRFLIEVYAVQK